MFVESRKEIRTGLLSFFPSANFREKSLKCQNYSFYLANLLLKKICHLPIDCGKSDLTLSYISDSNFQSH